MASKKYPLVVNVYSGRLGCMCGCMGTYSENSASISKVLAAMEANADRIEVMAGLKGELIFSVDTETRRYAVYGAPPTVEASTALS